ncbi:MAG: type II 3-dehydroquinate dehydratase [Chlorobi bacterium]|nr:type II 3-dehydroquinate dehydratase [Chlorobiota bacterium]
MPAVKIIIINGPNLNLLGIREKEIYGTTSFKKYFEYLTNKFPDAELTCYQSNSEGDIINKLHETGFSYDGIILNAAAYTHTSLALADAVTAINTPVVEVHISNIFARETLRHKSLTAPFCKGLIAGFGLKSYELAIKSFLP